MKNKKDTKEVKKDKPKIKNNLKFQKFNLNIMYLLIFSLFGLAAEFIYGFVITKKGLILGTLCIFYGICAVIFIKLLGNYKNQKIKIFIYGMLIGTLMEYCISFILEAGLEIKVWNFANTYLNFSPRINTIHIPIFGIISVLILTVEPYLNKLITKMNLKVAIIVDIISLLVIIFVTLSTVWALIVYTSRVKDELNGKNYTVNNTWIQQFQNEAFSNDNIKKIFPNIEITQNK